MLTWVSELRGTAAENYRPGGSREADRRRSRQVRRSCDTDA
jgi:hypothetical protein